MFIKTRQPTPAPLEYTTVRLSIRSLNKAIEEFTKSRVRDIGPLNSIKYLIDKVPKGELLRYSQHCVPFAVMCKNIIVLRYMSDKGFDMFNTWGLLLSLMKGYTNISYLLTSKVVGISRYDEIPLAWAAFVGKTINLNDLFSDRSYSIITHDSPLSFYRSDLLSYTLGLVVEFAKTVDKDYDNVVAHKFDKYFIDQCYGAHRHPDNWECQPPYENMDTIIYNANMLIGMCSTYSIDQMDRFAQLVRSYGLMRWGFIENGGHLQLDLFI
jgi:hypothetical protein